MSSQPENQWRRCSSCKKSILFRQKYWVCNVSTCNRKRTGLVFCTVSCWDAHCPMMNHRETWAEERVAPSEEEWARILAAEALPKKRIPKPEKIEAAAVSAAPAAVASGPTFLLRKKSQTSN